MKADNDFRRLYERARKQGLSQVWIANRLGVSRRTVHRWELGTYDFPHEIYRRMLALVDEAENPRRRPVDVSEAADQP